MFRIPFFLLRYAGKNSLTFFSLENMFIFREYLCWVWNYRRQFLFDSLNISFHCILIFLLLTQQKFIAYLWSYVFVPFKYFCSPPPPPIFLFHQFYCNRLRWVFFLPLSTVRSFPFYFSSWFSPMFLLPDLLGWKSSLGKSLEESDVVPRKICGLLYIVFTRSYHKYILVLLLSEQPSQQPSMTL